MMLEDFGRGVVGEMDARFPTDVAQSLYLCFFVSQLKSQRSWAEFMLPVIHKDINPNIVLNPGTGQIKIIDFGIATRFTTQSQLQSPHVLKELPTISRANRSDESFVGLPD